MKKGEKSKTRQKFILLFGIISAAAAAILLFAGIDYSNKGEGYAASVITFCVSILFTLFSVMINRIGLSSGNWNKPLFYTLTAQTAAEIILLIIIGKAIQPLEIICCVLTAAASAVLFFTRDDHNPKRDQLIPLILGIIAAGTGITAINTAAHSAFGGGVFRGLIAGIIFAALFMILSLTLTKQAFPNEQQNKAAAVSFAAAALTQNIGILYAIFEYEPTSLFIFQGCLLAALTAVSAVFFIRNRTPQKTGRRKKGKK